MFPAPSSRDGGAVIFTPGETNPPWALGLAPDRRHPLSFRFGVFLADAPPKMAQISWGSTTLPEGREVLRLDAEGIWLDNEPAGSDPETFGALRAFLVWLASQQPGAPAGFDYHTVNVKSGGPGEGGKPGDIVFSAHNGREEVRISARGHKIGGRPAGPGDVLAGLRRWVLP